jgi:hypothetical protein
VLAVHVFICFFALHFPDVRLRERLVGWVNKQRLLGGRVGVEEEVAVLFFVDDVFSPLMSAPGFVELVGDKVSHENHLNRIAFHVCEFVSRHIRAGWQAGQAFSPDILHAAIHGID